MTTPTTIVVCAGCKRPLLSFIREELDQFGTKCRVYERALFAMTLGAKRLLGPEIITPSGDSIVPVEYATVCSVACVRVVTAPGSGWECLKRARITSNEPQGYVDDVPYAKAWDRRPPPDAPLDGTELTTTRTFAPERGLLS